MSYRTKPGPESCRARPWGRGSVRHNRVATLGLVRDKFGIMWMISVHTSKNNKIVMANTASQTLETRPGTKTSAGRVIAAIARVLLGLLFLVFGLNGFLNFMPVPKDLPPDVITVGTWPDERRLPGGCVRHGNNRCRIAPHKQIRAAGPGIACAHCRRHPHVSYCHRAGDDHPGNCRSRDRALSRLGLSWRISSDASAKSIPGSELTIDWSAIYGSRLDTAGH